MIPTTPTFGSGSPAESLLKTLEQAAVPDAFLAVVGNPPYQEAGEGRLKDAPLYQEFMAVGQAVTARHLSLVHPSRWLYWERGELGTFAEAELASRSYVVFQDFSRAEAIFQGVAIAGGVCYYLWCTKASPTVAYSHDGVGEERETVLLRERVRSPEAARLVRKLELGSRSMSELVGAYGYYLSAAVKASAIEAAHEPGGPVRVRYVKEGRVASLPVAEDFSSRSAEGFKVFVSKTANRRGASLPRADRIFLGYPGEICSVSFLRVGLFATEAEAVNCLRYLKTDFANFLVGVRTPSHNTTARNYALVPRVDFATGRVLDRPGVVLDFSASETLDEQLAVAYGLTGEERELLRRDSKPWKSKVDVKADG